VNDSQTGSELAGEWLAFTGESGLDLPVMPQKNFRLTALKEND
jgi:hypothetical protein